MNLTIVAITRNGIIAPRTKKNSPQLIPNLKHPLLVPSEAYRRWERAAIRALLGEGIISRLAVAEGDRGPRYRFNGERVQGPANCRALIFRDRAVGDAVGFYQAIGDFLELAGVVANDRLIVSWDGSRLLKDAARPRVELELSPVGTQPALFSE